VQLFVFVDIGGKHHGHCRGSHADHKHETGQIEPPTDLVVEVGDDHAVGDLYIFAITPEHDEKGQEQHPGPEQDTSGEAGTQEIDSKLIKAFHGISP